MEKKCAYCGTLFNSTRKNNIYCSKRCKDNASKTRRGIAPTTEHEKVCPSCGETFITQYNKQIYCTTKCAKKQDRRHELSREEYNAKRKENARQRAEEKQKEKELYYAAHVVERECVYCGETFSCYDWQNNKTCSEECRRKRNNRHKDRRIPAQAVVDTDINIKRLFKRDGGKCYICGNQCNFDDWETAESGYKYPGNLYPEIDHVIPISRGGLHSWENVRLACHKCNHLKSDEIILIKPMSYERAYSEKRYGTLPKKTRQYTLSGELVRVWDSTAQIKRELGLNDKRVQAVCKGKGKTAFGYRWEYA